MGEESNSPTEQQIKGVWALIGIQPFPPRSFRTMPLWCLLPYQKCLLVILGIRTALIHESPTSRESQLCLQGCPWRFSFILIIPFMSWEASNQASRRPVFCLSCASVIGFHGNMGTHVVFTHKDGYKLFHFFKLFIYLFWSNDDLEKKKAMYGID